MKKWLLVLFTVLLCLSCFVACKTEKESGETNLIIKGDDITLSVGENQKLKWDGVDNVSKIVWSSSNENAVVVINGKIYAIHEGDSTVTAKLGDDSMEWEVSVLHSDILELVPTILTEREYLALQKGDIYSFGAKVIFGSEIVDAQIDYSTINSEVATVDKNGNITAVSYGSTVVYLQSQYNGVDIIKEISVNVFEQDIKIDFNYDKVDVCVIDAKNNIPNRLDLSATITCNGEEYDGPINWSIENDSYAEIENSASGVTIIGKRFGKTRVYAQITCDNETVSAYVDVNVSRAKVTSLTQGFVNLKDGFKFTLPEETEINSITEIKMKGKKNSFTVESVNTENKTVELSGEIGYGMRQIEITSENFVVDMDLVVASNIIDTDLTKQTIEVSPLDSYAVLSLNGLSQRATKLIVDNVQINDGVFFDSDSVKVLASVLFDYVGPQKRNITIKSGGKDLISNSYTFASFVLSDKDDLHAFGEFSSVKTWNNTESSDWYVVLDSDIDYEGARWFDFNSKYLWCGRFDGCGYSISNIQVAYGLFGSIRNGGIVQNLALINVEVVNNGEVGTWTDYTGSLASWVCSDGYINNCFIQVSSRMTEDVNKDIGKHCALVGINQGHINNCVVIADFEVKNTYPIFYNENAIYNNVYAYSLDAIYGVEVPGGSSSSILYKKKSLLILSLDLKEGKGWSKYWRKDSNGNLIFGKKIVVTK